MRPHGHSSRNIGSNRTEPGKKLHDVPQAKKDDGRDRQREDKNEGKNPRPRIEQHVSAHHAGDGAARADGRDVGMKIEEHV